MAKKKPAGSYARPKRLGMTSAQVKTTGTKTTKNAKTTGTKTTGTKTTGARRDATTSSENWRNSTTPVMTATTRPANP